MSFDDDDDFDKELELAIKEFEKKAEEFDEIRNNIDKLTLWAPLLEDLYQILEVFIKNMESLELSFNFIEDDNDTAYFLSGVVWCGIISAYEGFIHDLLHAILQKDDFFDSAKGNFSKLNDNLKYRLLNKNKWDSFDREILEKGLRDATLSNPTVAAILMEVLFDLPMPKINKSRFKSILKIRNAYAHNNGFKNGKKQVVEKAKLVSLHEEMDKLVCEFASKITNKFNNECGDLF